MNANGIVTFAGGASPQTGTALTAGKPGAAGFFAGALALAMDGGESGMTAASNGSAAGLLGLFGLFAAPAGESAPADLQQLLGGLSGQLELLDPEAELPEELQSQLASLLLMLQDLLRQTGGPHLELSFAEGIAGENAESGAANGGGTDLSGSRMLLQTVLELLDQVSDRVMQDGKATTAFEAALKEPFASTLGLLQQLTGSSGTGKADQRQAAERLQAADAGKTGQQTILPAGTEQALDGVQAEVRRSLLQLRQPVLPYLVPTDSASHAEGEMAPVTAVSGEAAGSNGSVPVWTLLKGDGPGIPAGVPNADAFPAQVPARNFGELIGKHLVKQFILTQGNGASEAKISLAPEHLGQVDIRIVMQNGQLTAQFMTETAAARDILETQMMQLRTALQAQGLQVDRMEVSQQSSSPDSASFFQNHHGQHSAGHQGDHRNGRGFRGGYGDSAGFEAGPDRTEFLREIGYGSSLNVTA